MTNDTEPKVGDVLQGRVIKHLSWGALIELRGGFVARLSNSQIFWSRTKETSDSVFDLAASITVIVREVNRSKAHGKLFIYLGYRELQPNPLEIAQDQYVEGRVVEGRIVEFREFGAIVEIADGIHGLLHDSEVSWTDRDAKASDQFTVGDMIPVRVRHSYKGKSKLSLSYRETQPDPWLCVGQQYPVGTRTTARVLKQVEYGVFATLPNGCVALLHKSQMTDAMDVKSGQAINFVVTEVDSERKRISLSIDVSGREHR